MAEKFEETHIESLLDEEESHQTQNEDSSENEDEDDLESIFEEEEISASSSSVETKKKKKKKALLEFRCRVEDAILGNYLLGKPYKYLSRSQSAKQKEILSGITLWGVPLLPSKGHQGTDIVLLKFLKAKDFKVQEAFSMLRNTLKWRREYRADKILEEKLGFDLDPKVLYLNSRDKEGHPLYFNVYEAFKDGEFYDKAFGSREKCEKFLRWRVQYMEKTIKKLNFKNGGVDSIVQITDLKNSPGPAMKELRSASKKALILLQDHYPELIHKNIVINTPFWYYAVHMLRSRFFTHRTKRKFVFARPTKVTKTLLKFIAPENLPVQYGGLKREKDDDFSPVDKSSEQIIKGNSISCIEFAVSETGSTMVWDLTVVGWDVSYKEEFVPDDEGSYKILLQNQKKMGESVRNSFYISEPGKILITLENATFKKKKVIYRSKAKPTVPMYIFLNK